MVKEEKPDIVGHLDKIKMQNMPPIFSEEAPWYQQEMMHTLEEIASSGSIIEVNTRRLYKKITYDLYPSEWVLEQIHQFNIPIVLNSDSHHPEEIDLLFDETIAALKTIGFKNLKILNKGQWEDKPL